MRVWKVGVFLLICLLVGVLVLYLYKFRKTDDQNIIKTKTDCSLLNDLDQSICRFLSFETPYTPEEISKKTLASGRGSISKLGLAGLSDIEGLLLDYKEFNDYTLLIVGFDDVTGSKRFITPLMIPSYAIENNTLKLSLSFSELNDFDLSSNKNKVVSKDRDTINILLAKLKNKVLLLSLTDNEVDTSNAIIIDNDHKRLIEEVNNRVNASKYLLGKVYGNNITSLYYEFQFNKLIEINNVEDINNINNVSINNIPIIEPLITYCVK